MKQSLQNTPKGQNTIRVKPRLSLCIATYNRAEYLGETLRSIIPQLSEGVEIVVVDGGSSDGTSDVVQGYIETCKQIKYIQLPAKGGVDQDFCKAVEAANGEYCWLFPDDDLLKPDAIQTVLDEISKGYSLIVVNSQVMNKDLSELLQNRRLQIKENEVYSESQMEQLFQRAVSYMSFIGAIVIKRTLWMQREKERYLGTEFIHLGVIFQAPLPAATLIIAKPYIVIRYGNAQWSRRAVEIWMLKWPNLLSTFTHISEQVRQECQMLRLRLKLRNLIVFRAMGVYTFKEYSEYFAARNTSCWWKFIAFFTVITPASFIHLLLLSYLKLFKTGNRMTIYDLRQK